ncbi:MAG: ABC transporter ATP-binding protein [Anaerocolumna sp.]
MITNGYRKQFFRNNRINYIITVFLCVLAPAFNVASAFLLKMLIDIATSGTMGQLAEILKYCTIYLMLLIFILVARRTFFNNYVNQAMSQYKNHAFENLLKKSINSFDREVTGKYISNFTNDIPSIENNYVKGNLKIIAQIFTLACGIAAMAYLNWMLMICVLVISLLPILVTILFGNSLQKYEKDTSDKNESFVGMVKDILTGFPVVKSFKADKEIVVMFAEKNSSLEGTKNKKRKTEDFIQLLSTVSSFLVEIMIFGIGAYFALKNIITAGTVIAFIQLLNFVLEPVGEMGTLITGRNAAGILIDKMEEATKFMEEGTKTLEKTDFNNSILYKEVSFGYNAENKVLKNINLEFEKGKSYVIVGSSGSGKSTLVNLMLGYHTDYSGTIQIDNLDLKKVSDDNRYDLFSVIQQNVFVFDNTIESNITMFRNFDKEEVVKAISKAGLTELIKTKGIAYKCGENGCNLSGGEKQRISIARSLIRNTPILIMDEATSALDAATAQMVEGEIAGLNGITRIVISHKLDRTILSLYDEIIVLSNGNIAEQGSFEQLMLYKGYFYSLYNIVNDVINEPVPLLNQAQN